PVMPVAVTVAVVVTVALGATRPRDARAADAEVATVEAVSRMNEKALEEYDNLSFDGARQTLEEALAACGRARPGRPPVAASAHLLLGAVILAGGPAARADAIAEFRKALEIRPGARLPERIANPEIEAALAQAAAAIAVSQDEDGAGVEERDKDSGEK